MCGKTRLFVGFVYLFTAVFLFMGGCGGGRGGDGGVGAGGGGNSVAELGPAGVIPDPNAEVAVLASEPGMEAPEMPPQQSGRAAAALWNQSDCPNNPPIGEGSSRDSAASFDAAEAFDGDHATTWRGDTGKTAWDIYYGFGTDVNNPAMELKFLDVNFYNDTYSPTSVRLYTSDDPCNAGWTDRGLLTANTWDASNPYIDLGSILDTNYIRLHMEDAGGTVEIRDVDWEPVNFNVGAHAWPSYNADVYYPSIAFDGNSSNYWAGKVSAGTWNMYYGFSSPTLVEMVSAELYNINYHPTTMNVYISDTGMDGSWTLAGKMGPTPTAAQYVGETTSYVRIEMTGDPPSNFPCIKEVTWDIPVGASSGDEYSSYYTANKAFDGDMNTYWAGDNTQSSWELFKRYPNPQFIEHIDVTFYASSHTPQTTELHCFNNGTWTDIGTFPLAAATDMDVNATCEILRFEMDGTGSYPSVGYPVVKDIAINKNGWIELDGSATGNGVSGDSSWSYTPSIATDSNGYPVIAWAANYGTQEDDLDIYLKRWNGSSWVGIGGSDSSGGISDDQTSTAPSLALNNSDYPYIAYGHWDGDDYDVFLQYWDGSVWDDLGGSATGTGISGTGDASPPDMVLDSSGYPIVTWHDDSSGKLQIYVRRWNGSSWAEMGSGSASGNGISNASVRAEYPKITLNGSGEPVITWVDNLFSIYTRRWNGSSWVEMDGSASNYGISVSGWSAGTPSIANDDNGNPVIAWRQSVSENNFEIYLKRWNGSSWGEVSGSATSGGISDSAVMDLSPDVFVNSSGDIFVAYYANISGQFDVLMKKWNGSSWAGIDGSATGGGISDNAQNSMDPSIIVDNNGNPMVAWNNVGGTSDTEIFFKRWLP